MKKCSLSKIIIRDSNYCRNLFYPIDLQSIDYDKFTIKKRETFKNMRENKQKLNIGGQVRQLPEPI